MYYRIIAENQREGIFRIGYWFTDKDTLTQSIRKREHRLLHREGKKEGWVHTIQKSKDNKPLTGNLKKLSDEGFKRNI